jgi:hypothetical protein
VVFRHYLQQCIFFAAAPYCPYRGCRREALRSCSTGAQLCISPTPFLHSHDDHCLQRQFWRATDVSSTEADGGTSARPHTATKSQGLPSTAVAVALSKPWCPAAMSPQKAHKVNDAAQVWGPRGAEETSCPQFWSAAKRWEIVNQQTLEYTRKLY